MRQKKLQEKFNWCIDRKKYMIHEKIENVQIKSYHCQNFFKRLKMRGKNYKDFQYLSEIWHYVKQIPRESNYVFTAGQLEIHNWGHQATTWTSLR